MPEVYFGETKLEEGKDYDVSYDANTNEGTGKVILNFKGSFTGTAEKTFKITITSLPEGTSNEDVFTGYGDISSVWTTDKNGVILDVYKRQEPFCLTDRESVPLVTGITTAE